MGGISLPSIKTLPLTTGLADGELLDADNNPGAKISADSTCGGSPCATSAQGSPLNCELFDSDPTNALSGSGLVGALGSIDTAQIGDAIVNVVFGCE